MSDLVKRGNVWTFQEAFVWGRLDRSANSDGCQRDLRNGVVAGKRRDSELECASFEPREQVGDLAALRRDEVAVGSRRPEAEDVGDRKSSRWLCRHTGAKKA